MQCVCVCHLCAGGNQRTNLGTSPTCCSPLCVSGQQTCPLPVCLSPSPVSVVGVLGNRAELPLYSSGIRTQVLTFAQQGPFPTEPASPSLGPEVLKTHSLGGKSQLCHS